MSTIRRVSVYVILVCESVRVICNVYSLCVYDRVFASLCMYSVLQGEWTLTERAYSCTILDAVAYAARVIACNLSGSMVHVAAALP